MSRDVGKEFEKRIKIDWESSIEGSLAYRIKDDMSGFHGSSNECDFILFKSPYCFFAEAKSLKGNTFNVKFRQYDDLKEFKDKHINTECLYTGLFIFFRDHHKVVWVPLDTFTKLREEGKKSFNIRTMLNDPQYESFLVKSETLRVYERCDFSSFINYIKEKENASN